MAYQPHERFWPGDPFLLKELVAKENSISAQHAHYSRRKGDRKDEIATNQYNRLEQEYKKKRNPFSEDHVFGAISKPLSREGKRSISVEDIISGKFQAITETDHRRRAQRRLEEIKPSRQQSYNELFSGSKDDDMFKSPRFVKMDWTEMLTIPEEVQATNNGSRRPGLSSRSVNTGSTMRSRGLEFAPKKHFSPNNRRNFSPAKTISTFR